MTDWNFWCWLFGHEKIEEVAYNDSSLNKQGFVTICTRCNKWWYNEI